MEVWVIHSRGGDWGSLVSSQERMVGSSLLLQYNQDSSSGEKGIMRGVNVLVHTTIDGVHAIDNSFDVILEPFLT